MIPKIYNKIQAYTTIIRTPFSKQMLHQTGKNLTINGTIKVIAPENITIGNNVSLNHGVLLNAHMGKITIGNNVHISPYAILNTAYLDHESNNYGVIMKHDTKNIQQNPSNQNNNKNTILETTTTPTKHGTKSPVVE